MNETIHCTQSQWDALIARVAASGRTDHAARMRAQELAGYTHRAITGGVRHLAPWIPVAKSAPEPTPVQRAAPAPAPAAPPPQPARKAPAAPPGDFLDELMEESESANDNELGAGDDERNDESLIHLFAPEEDGRFYAGVKALADHRAAEKKKVDDLIECGFEMLVDSVASGGFEDLVDDATDEGDDDAI